MSKEGNEHKYRQTRVLEVEYALKIVFINHLSSEGGLGNLARSYTVWLATGGHIISMGFSFRRIFTPMIGRNWSIFPPPAYEIQIRVVSKSGGE